MRRRPELLDLIDDRLKTLGLLDPGRHIAIAIAGYPTDAILAGFGIFEGKGRAGTLRADVDGRYLLGIVANVSDQKEGELITDAMISLRIKLRDRMLATLLREREQVCGPQDLLAITKECVDRAMKTDIPLDRSFWLLTLAEHLRPADPAMRDGLLRFASRRIHATFRVARRDRQTAARRLVELTLPPEQPLEISA